MNAPSPPPRVRATYRLQLGPALGFRAAARLVPQLAALGVSHIYASPYLKARSAHGYDIVDHRAFNPEIGDEEDFAAFVRALRRHGMGHVLDFVPNHMGIARADNAAWLDVLEWGPASPEAARFDVEWRPAKSELRDKVLAPFLGDHYGRALERGELRLALDPDRSGFSVWYFEHRFPLAPRSYALVLAHSGVRALEQLARRFRRLPPPSRERRMAHTARRRAGELRASLAQLLGRDRSAAAAVAARVRRVNGKVGDPASFAELDRILSAQHFRLAFWRVAADEINYRRFFNVNELAGIRVERPEVFESVHELVLHLIDEGSLDGLRIDHVDGLFDPLAYCRALRRCFGGRPVPIWVEKILAPHERLSSEWPIEGTTGYEFLSLVNGLFVDPGGEAPIAALYAELVGADPGFDEVAYLAKKHVLNFLFASELEMLTHELDRISDQDWRTRDFTRTSLREALKEVIALFPVYRTYIDADGARAEDRRFVEWAVERARKRSSDPETSLFDFLLAALGGDLAAPGAGGYDAAAALRFAMRFQQLTSPVAAKGVEDTGFFRYPKLLSLCEVGGDPRRFASSVAAFHHVTRERARQWPRTLLATGTHDTKLGEDARTRVDALSELAEEWRTQLRRWTVLMQPHRRLVDDRPAPSPPDELLLYQALLASWPAELVAPAPLDARVLDAYRERLEGYARKVVREAKVATSWRHPNPEYEQAVIGFVRAALDPDGARNRFLEELRPFQARVARIGAVSSLAQVLLKLTAPGVPDLYQGTELWDLSLLDPDNRRRVDWALRARLARELEARWRDGEGDPGELVARWSDGRAKLWLVWRLLALRRERPELLCEGEYEPLEVVGTRAEHVCAFARREGGSAVLVVAPRLVAPLLAPGSALALDPDALADTAVLAPADLDADSLREVTTGRSIALEPAPDGRRALPVARALARFPAGAFVTV